MWQLREITGFVHELQVWLKRFYFCLFFRLHCKMGRGLAGVTAQQVTQHRRTAVGNKHKSRTRKRRRPLGERWETVRSHWYAGWEAVKRTLLTHSSEIYPCDDIHWENKSYCRVVIWFLHHSHRWACCSLNSFRVRTPIKDPERRDGGVRFALTLKYEVRKADMAA